MMTHAAAVRPLPHDAAGNRPPMSSLRFFLTSYAGGLAFFLTVFA